MQTFLPYRDFKKSLESLDNLRLNKQVVETYQCIKAISQGPPIREGRKVISGSSWYNHPVCKMWKNNIRGLNYYLEVSLDVCSDRGINHTKISKPHFSCKKDMPDWLGHSMIHMSHQSNLVRKDPERYGKLFGSNPNMPYFWPVEIKCKKTGKFDERSGLWVKINTPEQENWYQQYL